MVTWIRTADGSRLNASQVILISVGTRSTGTYYVEALTADRQVFDLTGPFGDDGDAAQAARAWIDQYAGEVGAPSAAQFLAERAAASLVTEEADNTGHRRFAWHCPGDGARGVASSRALAEGAAATHLIGPHHRASATARTARPSAPTRHDAECAIVKDNYPTCTCGAFAYSRPRPQADEAP